jgi:hypothetical protein
VARSGLPRRRRAVGKERKCGAGRAEVLAAAWRPVEERRSAAMAAALAGAEVLDEMREAGSAPSGDSVCGGGGGESGGVARGSDTARRMRWMDQITATDALIFLRATESKPNNIGLRYSHSPWAYG